MRATNRLSRSIRASLRRLFARSSQPLVDLIHDVKEEVVGKIDGLDDRISRIESLSSAQGVAVGDEVAAHAAIMRSLALEIDNLQAVLDRLESRPTLLSDEAMAAREQIVQASQHARVVTQERRGEGGEGADRAPHPFTYTAALAANAEANTNAELNGNADHSPTPKQ